MELPEYTQSQHVGERGKKSTYEGKAFEDNTTVVPCLIDSPNTFVKLHREAQVKLWLKDIIPSDRQPGGAISAGDCFFHSIAVCLNQKSGKEEYSIQSLRIFCDEYVKDPKNSWVKAENIKDREDHNNYLVRIRFTAEELLNNERAGQKLGLATWGRPKIEGRIFCEQYNVRIHVIQIQEDGTIHRYLVDRNGETDDYNPAIDYQDLNILHIINYHNHFVPLLNNNVYIPQAQIALLRKFTSHVDDLPININKTQTINATPIAAKNMHADQVSIRRVQARVYTTSAEALEKVFPLMAASQFDVNLRPAIPAAASLLSTSTTDIKNLSAEEIIANLVIDEKPTPLGTVYREDVLPAVVQHVQINAGVAYVPSASVVAEKVKLIVDNEQVRTPNQLRQKLREDYQKNNFISRICYPNDPLPIEQLYVRLLIVTDDENQIKKEQGFKRDEMVQREDYLDTYESIHSTKAPIYIDSLYRVSLVPRKTFRYFIEGRAGIGKTTLLQYIPYLWSLPVTDKQQLWNEQFQWLFVIKLRNLDAYAATAMNDEDLLLTIIESECLNLGPFESLSPKERELLRQELRTEKILWCLDGFDEFNPTNDKRLQQFFNGLLNSKYVILTSRPHQFRSKTALTHLEITGFNLAAIHNYIDKSYANIKDINLGRIRHLKNLISEDKNLQGIMHVPINTELLCSVWHQKQLDLKNFTITELYKNIIELLTIRYLEKNQNNTELCEAMVSFLETLAFIGMLEYRVMLTMEDIEKALSRVSLKLNKHQVLQELKRIGLIKPTDNGLHFYFLHLSIQEYLAAGYLRNLLSDQISCKSKDTILVRVTTFVSQQKYNPRYQVMWWFLAGRLVQSDMVNTLPLQCYFDILCQAPFTLPGVHQLNLIVRCLNEAKLSESISQKSTILKYYAESLRQLIKGEYIPSGLGRGRSYLEDNKWLQYFLEVLSACPRIIQTPEMEEMFTDKGVNLEHFRREEILSQRVMEHVFLVINSFPQYKVNKPKIKNDLLIKYRVKDTESIINIILDITRCRTYDHFLNFGCHLLCKHINKNPNIILFLLEVIENFEGEVRGKLSHIFDTIEENNIYSCDDYDIRLLIRLGRIIHNIIETDLKLKILDLWESIIQRRPINTINILILLRINNSGNLYSILQVIKAIGKEAKTAEAILILLFLLKMEYILSVIVEIIKILFIWKIYDRQVILSFSKVLESGRWKVNDVKNLVVQLVELRLTGDIIRHIVLNFIDKIYDWEWIEDYSTYLMLTDYLYGVLTPPNERKNLLQLLSKIRNHHLAKLASYNLTAAADVADVLTHIKYSYNETKDSSTSEYLHVIKKFTTANNAKSIVEYFNNNTILVYVENGHLCFIVNKEIKSIQLTEEKEKQLISAFAEYSLLPLFITITDADKYVVSHLIGDKWPMGKVELAVDEKPRCLPVLQPGEIWKNIEYESCVSGSRVNQTSNEHKIDKPIIKDTINQTLFSPEQQICKEKVDRKPNNEPNYLGIQISSNNS